MKNPAAVHLPIKPRKERELPRLRKELTTVNEELQQCNVDLSKLSELNDDLNNLITGINVPVIILSSNLRIRRFTHFAEKALHLIPGDLGRPITDIKLNVAVPNIKRTLEQVIDSATAREIEGQDAQGRWHQVRIRPYKTKDNKIGGVLMIFVDIDPLKRSIEHLREARDYAEALFESGRQPTVVLDDALNIRRTNRAFHDLFRMASDDIRGRALTAIGNGRLSNPRLKLLLRQARQSDSVFRDVEIDASFPHLGKRTLLLNARRVRSADDQAPGVLVAFEDITERLQAEEAKELRSRATMQRELIANVSHELRTPVTAIAGASETLLRGVQDSDKKRFVGMIHHNAQRLSRLVDNVLRMSALESGRKPAREKIALAGFIDEFLHGLQPAAELQKVRLSSSIEPGMTVWFDKAHLHTVLQNVCENAIRYNKKGGRVKISGSTARNEAVLTIKDTGRGVSSRDLPRIFERFSRGDKSRPSDAGMGLGLPIAKSLVETNGGRISLTSAKNKGTTISITLPLAAPERSPRAR